LYMHPITWWCWIRCLQCRRENDTPLAAAVMMLLAGMVLLAAAARQKKDIFEIRVVKT